MPKMSPETQKELGLTDEQAEFDEFLQLDPDSPRAKELRKKLKIRKGEHPSIKALKRNA